MNILGQILEIWDRTVTSPLSRNLEIDVFKNPSRGEYLKLMKDFREMRGLLDSKGNLYVWNSYLATHADIEPHYNTDYEAMAYLILLPKEVWLNDLNYFYSPTNGSASYAPVVRTMWQMVCNNRTLKHIYGDFVPVGVDNDARKFHAPMTPEWIIKNVDT